MRKIALVLMAASFCLSAAAQDSLLVKSFKQLATEKSDRIKDSIADALVPQMAELLKTKTPASYNFANIANLGVVESPDGTFRIFNYNILYRDGTARHFAFIQRQLKDGLDVIVLNDKRDDIKDPNFEKLTPERWYGALYYQIVPTKIGKSIYYTLLGNSYNDLFTTRKVADVLVFAPEGIYFGEPLFFDGRRKALRVIFEYSARSTMTLKYFPEIKSLVFDHLVSSVRDSRDFQFMGPDGSQDSFVIENGVWSLKQNIDFKNPKKREKKQFKVSNY